MPLLPHHFGIFQLSVSNEKNSKVHLLWSDKYLSHYGNSYHLSTLPGSILILHPNVRNPILQIRKVTCYKVRKVFFLFYHSNL